MFVPLTSSGGKQGDIEIITTPQGQQCVCKYVSNEIRYTFSFPIFINGYLPSVVLHGIDRTWSNSFVLQKCMASRRCTSLYSN